MAKKTKGLVRINTVTDLRSEPAAESDSLGRIPAGTLVQLQPQKEEGYRRVTMELETGETLDGWVKESALAPRVSKVKSKKRGLADAGESDSANEAESEPTDNDDAADSNAPNLHPKKEQEKPEKVVVPQDEALLLRRAPTFLYGLEGGMNYGIVRQSSLLEGTNYTGLGFIGGGICGALLNSCVASSSRSDVLANQCIDIDTYESKRPLLRV